MARMIRALDRDFSVSKIAEKDLPECIERDSGFTNFYAARMWDETGDVFFFIAKGHRLGPKEVCVYYPNGMLWSGYRTNMADAIEAAGQNAWLYIDPTRYSRYKG